MKNFIIVMLFIGLFLQGNEVLNLERDIFNLNAKLDEVNDGLYECMYRNRR